MAQSAEGLKTTDVADQADSDKKMPEARRNTKSKAKWWRISDDHVSECSLKDVLSMQRDAYILFYERSRKP